MSRTLTVAALCCLALSSCDKAKDIASKAREVVGQATSPSGGTGGSVDPALQALVDETPDGFRFRNDLPFPVRLNVTVNARAKMKSRTFASSPLGRESRNFDGVVEQGMEFSLDGARATLVTQDTRVIPDDENGSKKVMGEVVLKGGSITMERKMGGWVPASDGKVLDFALAARISGAQFGKYAEEHGLTARPFWFGKGRVKKGDVIIVEGEHLGMLGFRKSSGTLTLKLEEIEAMHGHPCGVFSISGDASADIPDFPVEGKGVGDQAIESGKVWLSLLYPVVLREEINAVVTIRSGKRDENLSRSHGTASYLTERKWTIPKEGS